MASKVSERSVAPSIVRGCRPHSLTQTLKELKKEQQRAAEAKKNLEKIAASERHALALAQFRHVVLCKELECKFNEVNEEFRAAKQRLKETNKAINPFVRKKTTLRNKLTRLKKEKSTLEKKQHQHLNKVKTAETKVEGFEHKLDEELNNIDACKSKGLCCRPRHIHQVRYIAWTLLDSPFAFMCTNRETATRKTGHTTRPTARSHRGPQEP